MAQELAEKFIEALKNLESNNDVNRIVSLFAEDAEVSNVVTVDSSHELNPTEFWTNYRNTLGEVNSEFRNKIISGSTIALEWTTTGKNTDGGEIDYEGVSILETDGEKITRFFAYFNPNKLGRQITEETAKSKEA